MRTTASDPTWTGLSRLLGIRHPILLAPMGGVAGGPLAAAVSVAGGMGMIGGGYANEAWLTNELSSAGDERIGVGFITFALQRRPGCLDIALDAGAVAIQLSFGDPLPFIDRIHERGAAAICQVHDVGEAERCVEAGADVIIAQGVESGGHGRPSRGTFTLVPAVADAVAPVPVVAAGGIGDERGVAAALALGAAGVSVGTRFYSTREAIADATTHEMLVDATADDTVRTTAFDVVRGPAWPDQHDGRALRNELTAAWGAGVAEPDTVAELKAKFESTAPDDHSMRPIWAGEGVDHVDAIIGAGDVVRRLATGVGAGPARR